MQINIGVGGERSIQKEQKMQRPQSRKVLGRKLLRLFKRKHYVI